MADARTDIAAWRAAGVLRGERVREALQVTGAIPSAAAWRRFLDHLLLWTGIVALSASLGFFIAANWSMLGRFGKLALVEAAIVASIAIVAWRGLDSLWGKALIVVAALAVGTLLALVGQTYQTGADPWQLFAVWAVGIVPWVVVARQAPLALLWIGIVDVAAWLFVTTTFARDHAEETALWVLLGIHLVALVAWEALVARRVDVLAVRWAPRVLAAGALAFASLLVLGTLYDSGGLIVPPLAAYAAVLGGCYVFYRRRRVDLVVLAAAVLSLVVVVPAAVNAATNLLSGGGFLVLALITIGVAAVGAAWLRGVARSEP